jgi:hypothetical protein
MQFLCIPIPFQGFPKKEKPPVIIEEKPSKLVDVRRKPAPNAPAKNEGGRRSSQANITAESVGDVEASTDATDLKFSITLPDREKQRRARAREKETRRLREAEARRQAKLDAKLGRKKGPKGPGEYRSHIPWNLLDELDAEKKKLEVEAAVPRSFDKHMWSKPFEQNNFVEND